MRIGFDTETHLIAPFNVIPQMVCLSLASIVEAESVTDLCGTGEPEQLDQTLDHILSPDEDYVLVAHNAAFDLSVIARRRPDLIPRIFEMLEQGRVLDTKIREKLLVLASTGDLEWGDNPDGSRQRLKFSLNDLTKKYCGIDRSDEKTNEDAWRLNYNQLDGVPVGEWPEDAKQYALDDAVLALEVSFCQDAEAAVLAAELNLDPLGVQDFRVAVDFCLYLMSAWGFAVDPEALGEITDMLNKEMAPENHKRLIEAGILIPAKPERPHARGARDHVPGCKKKGCDCPVKMVKGNPEKLNKKKLVAYVKALAESQPDTFELKYTDPSDKFPEGQVSVDAGWIEEHYAFDPLLEEHRHRQKLQGLVTREVPRMMWEGKPAKFVHPCFDVLKRTGRTSSFASDLYPSFNCQNVDPRVRGCFVPRPGHWLFSIDYSGMELGTLGQTCLRLFGHSVLAEKINAGVDCHAFLGAALAYNMHDEFRELCDEHGVKTKDDIYECFIECKKSDDPEVQAFYKHWRKFAKPTGLGYPGGLGPKTFVTYARDTYGVTVDLDTAYQMRDIWKATFDEMEQYFDFINNDCKDERNSDADRTKYAYSTPFGMYRAGCDYCACANGLGLQSPSAEGALTGVFNVVRACFDPAMHSPLYGRLRPLGFIHDEIVGEVPSGPDAHDILMECGEIMVEAMRTVTPDVTPSCEIALMERWNKFAEPTYDSNGRLTLWQPQHS